MPSQSRLDEDLIQRLRLQAGAGSHRWTDVMRLLLEAADALERCGSIDCEAVSWALGKLEAFGLQTKTESALMMDRLKLMLLDASRSEKAPHFSAGGAYELKLYGTPGYVGTVAGITVYADPDVPEHTVVVKDELGRELGRVINVGK